MDTPTFVTEIVKALAWPATAVVLVLLLRKPITGLISLIQKLKYKDFEIEFGKRVEEIEVVAATAMPALLGRPAMSELPEKYHKLADASPRAVVTEAWRELEAAAQDAARRSGLKLSPREIRSPIELIQNLRIAEIVEPTTAGIMHDLRVLRNEAAHAPEFALERDSVLKYAEVAAKIAQRLKEFHPLT